VQHELSARIEPLTSTLDRPTATADMIAQFRQALREMRCVGSQRLLRRGVSMSHLHVMALIARHGELGMTRIADVLDVSLSNATGLIDRMEERGLVERVRVPDDRRAVHVRLTDTGAQALSDLEVLQDEVLARVLGRLDERQLARFVAAMGDLREAIVSVAAEDPDLFAHHHDIH
jgi:DNA-binding MarR family transcriptional regulator